MAFVSKKKLIKLGRGSQSLNGHRKAASLVVVLPAWWLQNQNFDQDRDTVTLAVSADGTCINVYITPLINIDSNELDNEEYQIK